ncbi:DUF4406 domain-containing protein [Priestia megaterium]|uniref:DUF4406 domain-containing protein n=1 Tax=Priestia megaterium TaxID=1404 RepID=UPI002E1EE8C9|nr:DUF4406 domain-containing protein [Priestia megaterium]
MKIYIAGKISGNEDYQKNFAEAEKRIKDICSDAVILNPAVLPEGMTKGEYMRIDFAMIDVADFVVMLDNAEESAGAQLEQHYCEYIGKAYYTLDGFDKFMSGDILANICKMVSEAVEKFSEACRGISFNFSEISAQVPPDPQWMKVIDAFEDEFCEMREAGADMENCQVITDLVLKYFEPIVDYQEDEE